MDCEVRAAFDEFTVLSGGKTVERIPAFLLKSGKLVLFGRQALVACELYPRLIYTLSRALLEEDTAKFVEIIDCLAGNLALNRQMRIKAVHFQFFVPARFMAALNGRFSADCPMQDAAVKERDGLLDFAGQSGKVSLNRTAMLVHEHQLAMDAIEHAALGCEEFRNDFSRLTAVMKALYPNLLRTVGGSAPCRIRVADGHGAVRQYGVSADLENLPRGSQKNELESLLAIRDRTLKATFISPFSYGKSTLINGIAGIDALKMEYTAETSAVTEVLYAPVRIVAVKFCDGRIELIRYKDAAALQELLPRYNSVSAKRGDVERVQVFSPDVDLPFVTAVDTPGLMSVMDKHDEITGKEVKNADVVFFLIAPEQIGENPYMLKVREYINKYDIGNYVFLINQLDKWNDRQEILEKELTKVLLHYGIKCQQTVKMSGLFCYVAKNTAKRKMPLEEVQKMRSISFFDPHGDLIAGKAITYGHMRHLLEMSNYRQMEQLVYQNFRKCRAASDKR